MKKNKSTFNGKLKAYSALAGSLLTVNNTVDAQILYTDVNPDFNGNTNGAFYNLDLNNDGTVDFNIQLNMSTSYYGGGGFNMINVSPYGSPGLNAIGSNYGNVLALNSGNVIDGNMSFNTSSGLMAGYFPSYYGGGYTFGNWAGANNKYLPLQITVGCEVFYGWARLDVAANASSFVVKDYAVNMTPNQFIAAGDMGASITGQPLLTSIENSPLNYIENDPATPITATITVFDSNSANLVGATVRLSCNYAMPEDVLAFTNQNGITGTFSSATGTLTLTGTSSVANYQTALRSVTYLNISESPTTAVRTAIFNVDDGSAVSFSQTRDINIISVNDNPVLTFIETTALDYDIVNMISPISSSLVVADIDNPLLTSATVQISNNYQPGDDILTFTNQNGITGTFNAAMGIMTLSGSASIANYQTALRSVEYTNTNSVILDQPARYISFIITDGLNISNIAARQIKFPSSVGIINNNNLSSLQVYPNPASNLVNIRFGSQSMGKVIIQVNDLIGKTVKMLEIQKSDHLLQAMIDLNGLKKGMYFIEVMDSKNKSTIKISKD